MDTSTMVINGLDVTSLHDDDLYARLQDLGSPVGPIVDSTRSVYQKKLFVLLGGEVPESPTFNGDVEQQEEEEEEYSDSEPEAVVDAPMQTRNRVVTESSRTTTYSTSSGTSAVSPPASQLSETRRRLLHSDGNDKESSGMVYDPDLHTPSPRRSLRTVTSSSSETTTYRRMVNNGKTSSSARFVTDYGKDEVDSSPAPGKLSSALRLLVKLLFLALIIAAALYFYQNNPTESPFKAIEEMARQALEAASGEEVTTSPEDANGPAALPPPQQAEVKN
ncbi:lamina-associated polypeptide 2, isoforms beta/delta/epsilon/gamma-like isoform X2 [Portunus trituberculatus]|nr:lamina-associated polypeptide 2, isoforms beta/delta/epsilon/gamma-like isoform X2 [Portunus trituberculatus]